MNKIISLALVAAFLLSASASAVVIGDCDLFQPDIRGGVNSTYQAWTFDDEQNPMAAVVVDNAAGQPDLSIDGDFIDDNVAYLSQFEGRDGVWLITNHFGSNGNQGGLGDITITIPNFANDNPLKEIWVQMVYQASDAPLLWAAADVDTEYTLMTEGEQTALEGDWVHGVWSVSLEPNPESETIIIRPQDCTAYIDCIAIDTQCIPEPASLALLGLGGLLLRKRFA